MEVESESYYNPFVLSPDGIIDVGYKDLSIGNKWADLYASSMYNVPLCYQSCCPCYRTALR
ncbi:hypothetical protein AG1IA_09740 [Rhizoctonia solani AG-1 IA]|uniref:Uncharacterized protein n=1 Tax=Thanatephorus cucumeris (strain AG1-IA) TaxID=983506 RepID=L8WE68_THACA|nr:hypothetical protein AG1IA_09740 [Rhizoctonia solani AG-1 IA]